MDRIRSLAAVIVVSLVGPACGVTTPSSPQAAPPRASEHLGLSCHATKDGASINLVVTRSAGALSASATALDAEGQTAELPTDDRPLASARGTIDTWRADLTLLAADGTELGSLLYLGKLTSGERPSGIDASTGTARARWLEGSTDVLSCHVASGPLDAIPVETIEEVAPAVYVGIAALSWLGCVTAGTSSCGKVARDNCSGRGFVVRDFKTICGVGTDVEGKWQWGYKCSFACRR